MKKKKTATKVLRKPNDAELLGAGIICLSEACGHFMEMKHEEGHALFRMCDSIMFYIEKYFLDEVKEIYQLPKPDYKWFKE